MSRDGTWAFDGDVLRIVPGTERGVHKLRTQLGEVAVPLTAVAGIAYEPGKKKGGRIRVRLRDGADPLSQATGGRLADAADPYQMSVDSDRTGVAEYFADEVRNSLLLEQVPDGPVTRYLLPGPGVPLTGSASEGTATFDGEQVHLDYNWLANESKQSVGFRKIALRDVASVDWVPNVGLDDGHLRFRRTGESGTTPPKYDPNCLLLSWGTQKEVGTTALLAAAVVARLPHPSAPAEEPAPTAAADAPAAIAAGGPADEDHDTLLRRLRELGDLHRDGVLTDEEFASAKQAVLSHM